MTAGKDGLVTNLCSNTIKRFLKKKPLNYIQNELQFNQKLKLKIQGKKIVCVCLYVYGYGNGSVHL